MTGDRQPNPNSMSRKIRVLFLPRWYPGPEDPMPGLFIRRHAAAITPWCDVAVISIHPSPDGPVMPEVEFRVEDEVRVLRIRYREAGHAGSAVAKVRAGIRYYRACMKAYGSIRKFSPDLVHVHVLTRMGLIGWRIACREKIPLVISEHWSRYFPENGTYRGWLRKMLTRLVVSRAGVLTAVSGSLRDAMVQCGLKHRDFRVVPNVVVRPAAGAIVTPDPGAIRTMVHVSCFDDRSKNISGFLRSLKALSMQREDFRCLLVGTGPDHAAMEAYAGELGLGDRAVFTGLMEGEEFWRILGAADFSVLSSRYETFGTVVPESLALGVPVVATATGIAPQVVDDSNGMLVPVGDEEAMTRALSEMIDRCRNYDRRMIAEKLGSGFDPDTVGQTLSGLYRSLKGVAVRTDNHGTR